jgi:hypothetical protein
MQAKKMDETIRKDILSVIDKSILAFSKGDISSLESQSDHTIHNSSIFQDKYSITTAVVIFSLYKLMEKHRYREYSGWEKFARTVLFELKKAKVSVRGANMGGYLSSLKRIVKEMNKLEKDVGRFVEQVIHRSKVKKATNIHRHGISSARVAELLDIPTWDVKTYLGATKEFDAPFNVSKSVKDRVKIAERLFGV